MKTIIIYLIALLCFGVLDAFWLGLVAPKFYNEQFGNLALRDSQGKMAFRIWPALGAYLLLALGLTFFITPFFAGNPALIKLFFIGSIFGLVVYGVYDFTNMATLTAWPIKLLVIDILWGMTAYGISSVVTFLISRRF